ncbi:hypothetical protein [Phycicoccus avicenniae]|uniref:hypothetical protein n=1 Tax=Phycicoccus avicenniae TaxID=2828860 RepID=UPI003D2C6195
MGRRSMVLAVVSAVLAAATVAGTGPAAAQPTAAAPSAGSESGVTAAAARGPRLGCGFDLSVASPSGELAALGYGDPWTSTWTSVYSRGRLGVTALGDTTSWRTPSFNYRRSLSVRGGTLWLDDARFRHDQSSADARTTSRAVASGWGSVTRMVDVSTTSGSSIRKNGYLYALRPSLGVLARYRVTEPVFESVKVARAGSRSGYGRVRTLALAFTLERPGRPVSDVLIATTSAGRLYLIEVPRTATFAPRPVLLRSSGWTVDDLAVSDCTGGPASHQTVMSVSSATHRARLHHLGRVDLTAKGAASTSLVSQGVLPGPWPFVRASSEVYWGFYQSRWVRSGSVLP